MCSLTNPPSDSDSLKILMITVLHFDIVSLSLTLLYHLLFSFKKLLHINVRKDPLPSINNLYLKAFFNHSAKVWTQGHWKD